MPSNPLNPLWVIVALNAVFFAFMVGIMLWESRGSNRIKDEPHGRPEPGGDEGSNRISRPKRAA